MLVTNGKITRKITALQLPQYEAKGYKEVKTLEKPKAVTKGKK